MRVLVVDDDPAIRSMLVTVLQDAGYEIDQVANGAEALAKLAEFQPDVMLLDLLMPVLDGFTVLRELREHADRPRVIVLSAIASLRESAYAHEIGAEAVLGKPFDIDDVLHAVDRRAVAR